MNTSDFYNDLKTVDFISDRTEIRYIIKYIENLYINKNIQGIYELLEMADFQVLTPAQTETILRLTFRTRSTIDIWDTVAKKAYKIMKERNENVKDIFFGFQNLED